MRARLQHVSTPYPRGEREHVREFYGGLLGLDEKPVPASLQHLDLLWFGAGDGELELHFLPDPAGIQPHARRHFCLEVEDLDTCRRRLADGGYEPYEEEAIPKRPRFFCRDPFGNLLEFTTILGDYREAEAV